MASAEERVAKILVTLGAALLSAVGGDEAAAYRVIDEQRKKRRAARDKRIRAKRRGSS